MLVAKLALVTLATATLLAAGGSDDRAVPSPSVTAVEPAVRHPYAVVVDPRGRVFVADGAARRIVLVSPRTGRRSVHASGFVEPTGLAATRDALYVADFHAGLVRRVDAAGRVMTLARLPAVTAVAVSPSGAVYAVTMDGLLVRVSAAGRIARVPVPGGLDRPHGIAFDRSGDILVAEDSRRVRRIDPATARTTLVVGGVDTNRIAVAREGTLFLAGSTLTGGSLRRLERGGKPTILLDDLHVSDVAVLPDGDLVATTVEPGAVFRVDPRTGARKKLVG
jgi:streptogramin lyase